MSEEKRTIHIKGTGQVTQAPDTVVLSLRLTSNNPEYSATMKIGSQQIELLREAIIEAGFEADDLKTTNFNVRAVYEDEEVRDGNSKHYRQNFVGFECVHDLKLMFDMSNYKLHSAIDAIAKCLSEPKISIAFAVSDTDALIDKILKAAARDAKRKAKVLCTAAGVKLGNLIRIDYPCDESDSRCKIRANEQMVLGVSTDDEINFDFEPEDIIATDSANFIWEIVD